VKVVGTTQNERYRNYEIANPERYGVNIDVENDINRLGLNTAIIGLMILYGQKNSKVL
jgi:hypothetical protein